MNNQQQNKIQVIAFYLPQFHTIPENDLWWGEGFTEWTNVKKAKPLFKEHYQPRIPGDLGYYDILSPKTREDQAELAEEAGISAFCYWHYWFGGEKQLLEKPLMEVVRLGKPDLPFCLSWANHSWLKKNWNADTSELSTKVLMEQKYYDEEDIEAHFYAMLPVFKDKRYYRLSGKLVFVFYDIKSIPYIEIFIKRWQQLAIEHKLTGFYFISQIRSASEINSYANSLCDAVNLYLLRDVFDVSKWKHRMRYIKRKLNMEAQYGKDYVKATDQMNHESMYKDFVYPTIIPNWDTVPRRGKMGDVLIDSTPQKFYSHVTKIFNYLRNKKEKDKIVFLKSWNEWAEGNYLEPDQRDGKDYMHALRKAIDEC